MYVWQDNSINFSPRFYDLSNHGLLAPHVVMFMGFIWRVALKSN